jgi:hypothetical protein
MPDMTQIGRLALREEGEWWNAYYYAMPGTMDGALHLGSIRGRLHGGDARAGRRHHRGESRRSEHERAGRG